MSACWQHPPETLSWLSPAPLTSHPVRCALPYQHTIPVQLDTCPQVVPATASPSLCAPESHSVSAELAIMPAPIHTHTIVSSGFQLHTTVDWPLLNAHRTDNAVSFSDLRVICAMLYKWLLTTATEGPPGCLLTPSCRTSARRSAAKIGQGKWRHKMCLSFCYDEREAA
jgi:hypothetical protein